MKEKATANIPHSTLLALESALMSMQIDITNAAFMMNELTNSYGYAEDAIPCPTGVVSYLTKRGVDLTPAERNSFLWCADYERAFKMAEIAQAFVFQAINQLKDAQAALDGAFDAQKAAWERNPSAEQNTVAQRA